MSTTRRSLARVVAGLVAAGKSIGDEVQKVVPPGLSTAAHLVGTPVDVRVVQGDRLQPRQIPTDITELTNYRRALRDRTITGTPCATLGIKSYSAWYRRHKEAEAFATGDRHPVDKMLREFWRNMT